MAVIRKAGRRCSSDAVLVFESCSPGAERNSCKTLGIGSNSVMQTLERIEAEVKQLSKALRASANQGKVTQSLKSPHGQKYVMVGRIESPGGKSPLVRTIWIVDSGSEVARLVTAYPHEE